MARILLVEDHTLFRAGVRALIERSALEHTIIGEASNGHLAVRMAQELTPDVILMDVSMPELNGIEVARMIRRHCPSTRIVMPSMHADPAYVYAALDAGAQAYVLKDAAFSELQAAVRSVLAGQKYLSAGVRINVDGGGRPQSGPASRALGGLSSRERQILQLIGEAFTSPEIAEKLGLRVRTVETYRQRMMDKLNLHSVAALTAFAIGHGLCSADTTLR